MAIADKPILDPEPSRPGIPLKKSTLAVLAILVLVLGFVSSLVFSSSSTPTAPSPVVKDATELKQLGTNQAIKEEEALAAKGTKPAASAAVAAHPPLPAAVRRDDNSAAFYDKKLGGVGPAIPAGNANGRDKELEFDAATRMAKVLAHDFDDARSSPIGRLAQEASGGRDSSPAAESRGQAPVEAPSSALAGQIDLFKKQLMQVSGGGKNDANWMKEYEQEATSKRKFLTGYALPKGLVLRQGKIIPAVLGRQINSDLPGRITAYVTSNVYDSDGNLLIPMGSSLVGRYDSGVKVGQSRLMFAFERLILPNGYSFDLPAAAGTDLAGAAGVGGEVNNHFLKMFGTSLLIAVAADRGKQPQSVTQIGASGPSTGAGQVLADVSKSILERNRTIAPTITLEQGTRINVEVVSDMVFPETFKAPSTP
jgi:type IV secretory pathway VirB10-like protein